MTGPGGDSAAAGASRVLRASAEPGSLAPIRRFVETAAIELGADPAVVPDVIQAVDESVTNIIKHGYQGDPGIVEVEVRIAAGALVVRLRDHATPFDPTNVATPDLDRPLGSRPLGGMGVHLARELTDDMRYGCPEGWSNELTLIKRMPAHVTRER
jgi:anti-sigma regulatory factor (Ser/Thr protein kinase)